MSSLWESHECISARTCSLPLLALGHQIVGRARLSRSRARPKDVGICVCWNVETVEISVCSRSRVDLMHAEDDDYVIRLQRDTHCLQRRKPKPKLKHLLELTLR